MPRRPPKKWFKKCIQEVEQKADVSDPNAICGWIWHHHASKRRKREIMEEE